MNGFDLEGALVPVEQIHSGGPPRDGIPSIDHPKFIAPAAARYLRPDDLVVSVTVGSETRAYPLRILVWHEIVNDTIGDKPVAITYCPLCGTAIVFDRRYDGRALTFGVSGLLYVHYDPETRDFRAENRETGELIPAVQAYWFAWQAFYPEAALRN